MRATNRLLRRPVSLAAATALMLNVLGVALFATTTPALAAGGPCTTAGTAVTCDLWAKTGSVTLPSPTGPTAVPVWGYATSAAGAAQAPGPVIVVTEGDHVTVNLHNALAEASSLAFPGIVGLVPDTTGAAPGASRSYTFTAARPGTFIYQAGHTAGGARQVAMGMAGALVVRPVAGPGSAYGGPDSSFDDEAVLVLSEIDPALAANPAGFDLRNFSPRYRLLNGKVFPGTDPIPTAPGHRLLLRYVNAGVLSHSIGVLGAHQTVLASDGHPLAHSYRAVNETIPPGQSLDTLVAVPAATPGLTYPLYEPATHLDNAGTHYGTTPQLALGGMLTMVTTGAAPAPGPDSVGPATSHAAVSPARTNGSAAVTLSADVSDVASGNSNVVAAEYFFDNPATGGTGAALASAAFGTTPTVTGATASISTAALAALPAGNHTIYVHGRDSAGNWGAFTTVILNLDKAGPATTGVVLSPTPTNGTMSVAVSATGDETNTGGGTVTAAEYRIDTTAGPGQALVLNRTATTVAETATIAATTVAALAEGPHTVYVRSRDDLGTWGADTGAALNVDKTGPAASAVTISPNPNDGTMSWWTTPGFARVSATLADPTAGGINSAVVDAEGFIDTPGANGSGFHLLASDGLFDSPSEGGYASVPLSQLQRLSSGNHTVSVHGLDAAGNWGPFSSTVLVITRGPAISNLAATPNPTGGAPSTVLTATATEPGAQNVVAAEWFDGADPGPGLGTPMAAADGAFNSPTENLRAVLDVRSWAAGNHTVTVRARDAGSWGTPASVVIQVVPPTSLFADGFESGNFSAWSSKTGSGATVTGTAAISGAYGMRVAISGNTPGYVTDNTPSGEAAYHAQFSFNPNGLTTNGSAVTIFAGRNSGGTTIMRLQYRRSSGLYQVRAAVRRSTGETFTSWYTITNAAHTLKVDWTGATAGSLKLSIDGTLKQTLTGNTNAYRVGSVRLGPSAGLASGMSGSAYFDNFVSSRVTLP